MSLRDFIYRLSPIFLQNLLISAYGYKLIRERYGAEYKAALAGYARKNYQSIKEELSNQNELLQKLIDHAVSASSFYRDFYKSVDISTIKSARDLKKLPILEKEILRENLDQIYTIPLNAGIQAFTGGTTGKSLRVVFTKNDFQRRMAYLDAFKMRCGIDPMTARKATFSGRSFVKGSLGNKIFWRNNYPYRQRLYSTFDMSPETLPFYVDDLNEFEPQVINGFVSAIFRLAKHINSTGVRLKFSPQAIFTTSETLLEVHRTEIERAFKAPLFDQYSSSEGAPFITECLQGRLHYHLDTGVIEIEDFGRGPEMLVTSFSSFGTPLIRYRIGDGAIFSEEKCECGSVHPVVSKIEGRAVDHLVSRERGLVSLSHLSDVIKGLPNCVKEMQFIQDSIDEVILKMVVDSASYSLHDEMLIAQAMKARFGQKIKLKFDYVEAIQREKSGKFSIVKCSVPTDQLH